MSHQIWVNMSIICFFWCTVLCLIQLTWPYRDEKEFPWIFFSIKIHKVDQNIYRNKLNFRLPISRICLQCRKTRVGSLRWEDPLEKEMATPVFLPGEFHGQTTELQGVGQDWVTNTFNFQQNQASLPSKRRENTLERRNYVFSSERLYKFLDGYKFHNHWQHSKTIKYKNVAKGIQ